jgi:cytochrome c556
MKIALDTMKEMQDHPIKAKLQKAIAALETKVAEIKERIAELKTNIVEGCKNCVQAFKEKGAAVLDKLASFFHIKSGLQAIKNNTVQVADNCDKAIANIETFSKQYHTAGRAFKNMARMAVGKKPIDAVKESGKLAKVICVPYKAEKAIQVGIRKQVNKIIAALDKLEQSAEAKRSEKAVDKPKKPTLMERLDARKKEIKERELEAPKKERVNVKGAEI